jgi:hypothetical protein
MQIRGNVTKNGCSFVGNGVQVLCVQNLVDSPPLTETGLIIPAQCFIDRASEYLYQYSETNVIHLLLNLLRIKGLYMF